jgi:carbamoyltransferase
MLVFGYGGSGHDFSTCIFKDDKIIAFIEDERILREKHSFFPGMGKQLIRTPALQYCMQQTGLHAEKADYIVANSSLERYYYVRTPRKQDIVLINHHLAHAASAFYPSNFERSAILVIDGAGNSDMEGTLDSITLWIGEGNHIEKIAAHGGKPISRKIYGEMIDPAEHSIGGFYHIITHLVGFGPFDQGKTMGLSPYGTDKYYSKVREFIGYGEQGSFIFSIDQLNALMEFGETLDLQDFNVRADLAWAGQKIAEEAVIHSATYLKRMTGVDNICIAGGVALNSVANYKLYKTGMFKQFFIQPAAGDNGTSLGAAYYGAYALGKLQRYSLVHEGAL